MKNQLCRSVFLAGAFLLINLSGADAQQRPGNDGNPDQPHNCGSCTGNGGVGDGNAVPIDGGASLLLAAGAIFGLKKLRDYHKANKQDQPAL
jgi:hypothetical protein